MMETALTTNYVTDWTVMKEDSVQYDKENIPYVYKAILHIQAEKRSEVSALRWRNKQSSILYTSVTMKGYCTINSDASVNPATGEAGYALWINCDLVTVKIWAPFKNRTWDSNIAEI